MNKAIVKIGIEELDSFFELLIGDNSDPIISIGSGLGSIEAYLEDKYGKKIICVDPVPYSWQEPSKESFLQRTHAPDYNKCNDLIKDQPDLVGNSNLFLNWALPNDNGENYDLKAIMDLKPKRILVICESSGGAGGNWFLHWYRDHVTNISEFTESSKDFYWIGGIVLVAIIGYSIGKRD